MTELSKLVHSSISYRKSPKFPTSDFIFKTLDDSLVSPSARELPANLCSKRITSIAYHEAGHAVVAAVKKIEFIYVALFGIGWGREDAGHVWFDNLDSMYTSDILSILFAGVIAEQKISRRPEWALLKEGGSSDRDKILRIWARATRGSLDPVEKRNRLLMNIYDDTKILINKNMSWIRSVAKEIVIRKHHRLSYSEVTFLQP